jgi:hypothetical protein
MDAVVVYKAIPESLQTVLGLLSDAVTNGTKLRELWSKKQFVYRRNH